MKQGMILCIAMAAAAFGTNPIITTMYTADPSAHVWADGKLWLYPSHDRNDAQWWDMTDWHVFSSVDCVTWTDHGVCLSLSDIPFAKSSAWAPDCAYRNGTYYFYFPVSSVSWNSNTDNIGVATSANAQGPFTVVPTPIVTGGPAFDPCVFIDDDGQAYLYCGSNAPYVGKLQQSMTALDGSLQAIQGATGFLEAIWMHKRNGIYYLSYSSNGAISYCMGTSPTGPFTYKGVVLTWTGTVTIHASIVEYQGTWLMFYHNQALPGGNAYKRSVCVDRLYYNADGTMKQVVQTAQGVSFPTSASRNRRPSNRSTALCQVTGTRITVPSAATITVVNVRAAVALRRRTGGPSSVDLGTLPAGRYSVMIEQQRGREQMTVAVLPRR